MLALSDALFICADAPRIAHLHFGAAIGTSSTEAAFVCATSPTRGRWSRCRRGGAGRGRVLGSDALRRERAEAGDCSSTLCSRFAAALVGISEGEDAGL